MLIVVESLLTVMGIVVWRSRRVLTPPSVKEMVW